MSQPTQSPLTVTSLGLSPESIFGISSDPALRELGEGYSSGVFEVTALAMLLKIGEPLSYRAAEQALVRADEESAVIRQYLGDTVVNATFSIQQNGITERFHVVTIEDIARGVAIAETPVDASDRARILRPLLRRSLRMYESTGGLIPDISRLGDSFYDPTMSPHIFVSGSERVKLVHPTFSEAQRSAISGRLTNKFIAAGARHALRRVER